jgi:hypothetical protein
VGYGLGGYECMAPGTDHKKSTASHNFINLITNLEWIMPYVKFMPLRNLLRNSSAREPHQGLHMKCLGKEVNEPDFFHPVSTFQEQPQITRQRGRIAG